MSFWVGLDSVDGSPLSVEPFEYGGTRVFGGSSDPDLNVTYNYSPFYYKYLDSESGLRWLDGKVAGDTIDRLESAVRVLGVERDSDYWAATPGNAGMSLSVLLFWARQHPRAVWRVD